MIDFVALYPDGKAGANRVERSPLIYGRKPYILDAGFHQPLERGNSGQLMEEYVRSNSSLIGGGLPAVDWHDVPP